MLSLFQKYLFVIPVLLFVALLGLVWLFPAYGFIFTMLFLSCGFVIASLPVIEKHRQAYLQGKVSRRVYMRNLLFDVTGIVLALILAALLGRYIAELATRQIDHDLIRLIAGITIGLLIGLAIGLFVKQAWERLVRTSTEN